MNQKDKTFLIKWYGPFKSLEEEYYWEIDNDLSFNLYLIHGRKKHAKTKTHYYVGQTSQGVYNRFKNKGHHINDFSEIHEIWVGSFFNISPEKTDINLAEKMITSYLAYDDEVGNKLLLNVTNTYAPNTSVYIINRWYNKVQNEWQRHGKTSLAKILADVIAYKLNDANECILFEAKKLKRRW